MIKTPPRNAKIVLDKLTSWRVEGQGVLATCPCHDDAHESLKVDIQEEGRLLLYCRAGCKFVEVATYLGANQGDTWRWPDQMEGVGDIHTTPSMVDEETLTDLGTYVVHASDSFPGSDAETYALSRFGITDYDARKLRLGFSPEGGDVEWSPIKGAWKGDDRLVVPFLNFQGIPAGSQARALGAHSVKWTGLANADDGSTWSRYAVMDRNDGLDYILITEGPSDGLTAYAAGFSAIVIRGAALGRQASLLEELEEYLRDKIVIIAGDADRSGEQFKRALVENLNERGIDARPLDIPEGHNDLNDWYTSDKASFKSTLETAVRAAPVTLSSSSAPSVWDALPDDHPLVDGVSHTAAARAIHWYIKATKRDVKHVQGFGLCIFDRGKYWLNPEGRELRMVVHEAQLTAVKYENPNNPLGELIHVMGHKLGMSHFINPLLKELESIVIDSATADDFDSREELLLAKNGVINLATGELLEPTADMLMSNELKFNYDPKAECPRWIQFIDEVMCGDEEMVAFVQRLIGYGITGSTKEQCLAIFQGNGANGKSVLTDTLAHVFSSITKTAPFNVFETGAFSGSSSSGPSTHIARLRGSRLTLTSEGQEGKAMDEAIIKVLTGGDVITARHMRSAEFEFKPQHLIVMSTNHQPRFKGVDEGLWRRIKIVKFKRFFEAHERDRQLDYKLKSEAEGIIAWAVRGAVEWFDKGLETPDQVKDATQELREDLDPLKDFLEDKMEVTGSVDDRITLTDFIEEYTQWCEENFVTYPIQKLRIVAIMKSNTKIDYRAGAGNKRTFFGIHRLTAAQHAKKYGV